MSVEEMRKELGISRTAAYKLARRKDFPIVMLGNKRVMISREGLEVWLKANTRGISDETAKDERF